MSFALIHSTNAFAVEANPFYKKYEHQFADTNRDGVVSLEESQKEYAGNFRATDASNDGKLSLEEMCNKNAWYNCTELKESGEMSFKKLDANSDGFLIFR